MAKKLSDLAAPVQAGLLVAVSVLIAGFAFWYFVLPLSAQRDTLQKRVTDLHDQNVKNRSFEKERATYLTRISEADKQLQLLRSIVPDAPNSDEIVQMIHQAESASLVHVRALVSQPLVNKDLYTEMPFKLRVDGTYFAVLDFFNRLAQGQRIANVSDLALGTPEGGGLGPYKVQAGETVGANCILTTFFNRAPGAAPPAPVKK